ncbi:unnamed protein product [Echinostoma caproni]|uniref:protein-tyrosine-phosphatase n=1 Tax=Echinostoma caproni TaxID=27848 RepID=A0A183A506_9TREM|nr:unnamed protein product [Echinostoma caproni]
MKLMTSVQSSPRLGFIPSARKGGTSNAAVRTMVPLTVYHVCGLTRLPRLLSIVIVVCILFVEMFSWEQYPTVQSNDLNQFRYLWQPWSTLRQWIDSRFFLTIMFPIPCADGFLFQDLLNLSEVIENKAFSVSTSFGQTTLYATEKRQQGNAHYQQTHLQKQHRVQPFSSTKLLKQLPHWQADAYVDNSAKINKPFTTERFVKRDTLQSLIQYDPQQSIYYVQRVVYCVIDPLSLFDALKRCEIRKCEEKPRIIRPPESVATIVGQSVLFVCLVEGNPAPKVQWKISGADVSEARFGKTVRAPRGSVLRVTNTVPSHNGAVITCMATNALGRTEQSANLIVYADERAAPPGYPKFLNSFSVIVAKKNAGVELECRASGDPQPVIDWFKNSVPVDLTNPRFEKLSEGNLRISNLVEEDEGKYECAATNNKGTRLSSGDNLLVRAKRFRPHFTNIPAPRQIVPPGGRLALSCTAVGAPVPTVEWYRGNRRLHRERLDQQPPGTARILLLDLSESINVTCVAESPMGRIYHDVQVVVKRRPYLADLGASHARLAFEPSIKSSNSTVTNYLLFWIASKLVTNETLHAIPQNVLVALHNPNSALSSDPLFNVDRDEKPLRFSLLPPVLHPVVKVDEDQVKLLQNASLSESSNSPNHFTAILASLTLLKPYTEYTVWVRAVGPDGDASLPSPALTFTTNEMGESLSKTVRGVLDKINARCATTHSLLFGYMIFD